MILNMLFEHIFYILMIIKYHITFNPIKSKLICFNVDPSDLPPVYLNNHPIAIINNDVHLGNYISSDILDRNIMSNIGCICSNIKII